MKDPSGAKATSGQNVYWGTYYDTAPAWIKRLQRATSNIETDASYSGGLVQFNVRIGKAIEPPVIIGQDTPALLSDEQIKKSLTDWTKTNTVPDLLGKGAY